MSDTGEVRGHNSSKESKARVGKPALLRAPLSTSVYPLTHEGRCLMAVLNRSVGEQLMPDIGPKVQLEIRRCNCHLSSWLCFLKVEIPNCGMNQSHAAVLTLSLKFVSVLCSKRGRKEEKNNRQTDKQNQNKIEP